MQQTKNGGRVISAALILGVSSLASDLVALVRERVFTASFGAGDTFDIFVAAFRVPDLVFNLIVIGALSAAFIPLFTDKLVNNKGKGNKSAFDFSLSVLNSMLVAVSALMALFALLAPVIIPLITPGFTGEKLELTIMLSRVVALQPILLTISFVFSGVLNSFQRFVAYAVAPILYNCGVILGAVLFYPWLGVTGLGWGVVLGAAFHMLVQFPSVLKTGWRWKPVLAAWSADMKALWVMMVPRTFALAAQQINLLIATIIGSLLLSGSISALYLANNVQFLPISLFGIAFAQAAFPTMAEQIARKRTKDFVRTLTSTIRYVLFFVIPASIFLFLLRAQIVRVLFGGGAFDWEDTILTFQTLGWLSVGVFAQSLLPLLTRAFYVQRKILVPVVASVISILVNTGLALILAPKLGVPGIAIAISVEVILNVAILLVILRWQLGKFDGQAITWSVIRLLFAALGAGAAVQLLKYPVAALVDMQRFWGVFMQLLVATAGGGAMYFLLCWLFDCDELSAVRRYLPKRFRPTDVDQGPRFESVIE